MTKASTEVRRRDRKEKEKLKKKKRKLAPGESRFDEDFERNKDKGDDEREGRD